MLSVNPNIDINWHNERSLVRKFCGCTVRKAFILKYAKMDKHKKEQIHSKISEILSDDFTSKHRKPPNMVTSSSKHKTRIFNPIVNANHCHTCTKTDANPCVCNSAYYCSKECQLKDYTKHKKDCKQKREDLKVMVPPITPEKRFNKPVISSINGQTKKKEQI